MEHALKRAAVLGAGTMGAAIAAHLANRGIPTYLLDMIPKELNSKEKEKGLTLDHPAVRDRIVKEGWERCIGARPANLLSKDAAELITLGNLEDNFDWVGEADWIVESIVEQLEAKMLLMARIDDVRKAGSIVSTNTSGIPIKNIAAGRSEDFKIHFLGTHFFNPPAYIKLLEIIPHDQTHPQVLDFMKEYAARTLGKGVVICKDTPNFIANRLFSIVGSHILNYIVDNGYTVEEADLLTGPIIGHPKAATFRLYDLVGLDVHVQVSNNLYHAIPHDPYREELIHEKTKKLLQAMVERKWLGKKTGQGFYKRVETDEGREYWALDLETLEYQPPKTPRFETIEKYKGEKDIGERIKLLCTDAWGGRHIPNARTHDRAAKFVWDITAFGLNYAASLVPEVTADIQALDSANKWGYSLELGPFETWDRLGVAESVEQMEADGMKVTPWVKEFLAAGYTSFYRDENGQLTCYDPARKDYAPKSFSVFDSAQGVIAQMDKSS